MDNSGMSVVALLEREKFTYLTHEFFNRLMCKPVSLVFGDDFYRPEKKRDFDISKISLFVFHYESSVLNLLPRIELLKKTYPSIPIIMTVEKPDDNVTRWALRFRMWDCITLPDEVEHLQESIKHVLKLREVKDYPPRSVVFPSMMSKVADPYFDNGVGAKKTSPALIYIYDNYSRKITLPYLSKLCNMSISNFSIHFKSETGYNFRRYLVEYRMNIAKKLLEETNLKVKEIASAVGIEDPTNFNRLFKQTCLITPSEFRGKITK